MRRQRKTKIIATLGPASSTADMIAQLFEAGADVFRLNFSHGEPDDHRARIDAIRALETRFHRPIGVLMDLQGPKLRLGEIENDLIEIRTGASIRLDMDEAPGTPERLPLPHPEIFAAVKEGDDLLIDDGRLMLRVTSTDGETMEALVLNGGEVSPHKGVNVPNVVLPLSPMTDKDRTDLELGLELGVDWVALSFVQRAADIEELRGLVGGRAGIMAKLEKPAAIDDLEAIIAAADAVMIARGDLGVECPPETVPGLQKRIVRAGRQTGKPVAVATQMLDSMIHTPVPTRAEASDVATAVYDGADAVMLSGETAMGKFPLQAVEIMNRIINSVESDSLFRQIMDAVHPVPEATSADAISAAARQVAETLTASAIVTYTTSGSTTFRAARERSAVPIIGLTPRMATARRLALVWGVHSMTTGDPRDFGDMVARAVRLALQDGFAEKGDRLVITAGVPFGTPGRTNVLRLARVGEENP
jgi:pyruvate kinase